MTKYGKMIADVVMSSCDHPTAEQIYLRIQEQGTRISLATVYNNLKTLVEEGTLRRITVDGSPDRFDKPTGHQHLICGCCGQLVDVELGDLSDVIRSRTGLEDFTYEIRIQYVCEACRRRREKDDGGNA